MFKDSPFNADGNNFVNKTQDISSNWGIVISFIGDNSDLLQIKLTLAPKLVITRK